MRFRRVGEEIRTAPMLGQVVTDRLPQPPPRARSLGDLMRDIGAVEVGGPTQQTCQGCSGKAVVRCSRCGFKACALVVKESPDECPVCVARWFG